MKALSILQPWASLIAIGAKQWETRSRRMHFRGIIAIHASAGFPKKCRDLCFQPPFWPALIPIAGEEPTKLPTGVIVAVARLTDCIPSLVWIDRYEGKQDMRNEFEFGDYSVGRYALKIEDVRILTTPIPAKGTLGLWNVPPEIEAAVNSQLE